MSKRLRDLAVRLVASGPKAAHVSASECHEISDGLIELLDLLETPMPKNWPAPTVGVHPHLMAAGRGVFVTGGFATPDEALALGAALIRAALEARGGK